MRSNRHIRRMIILTVAICLIAIFIGLRDRINRTSFDVALVPRKGMTIISENPVKVKRGKSAAFLVQFDESSFHNDESGLRYENGILYVDNVSESRSVHYAPRRNCTLSVRPEDAGYVEFLTGNAAISNNTAEIRINPPEHYNAKQVRVNEDVYSVPSDGVLSFPVYDDSVISVILEGEPVEFTVKYDSVGTVRNLQEQETYGYGDTVTLRAEYDSNYVRFDGWSTGAYLSEGGAAVSTEAELSLTLHGDTGVYANFIDLQTYTVTVDPNGGRTDVALVRNDCSAGKTIFLPADTGAIYRDGYTLIGYNTLPDGSGQHFAPASPMMVKREDATVYAQWIQQTPADAFSYGYMDGFVVINGINRDVGDTLVIPPYIDGVAAKAVNINAFVENTALKTVVISLGVTHIGDGAFSACPNLSMVYLPDTVQYIGAGAFEACPSFSHMRVLSQNNTHVYERTFDSALADRYMRLLNTEGKRIILVAGSSGSFGLNSNLLAEHYPDYEIKRLQDKLNTLYDTFIKKYGLINTRANASAFCADSAYCLLCSLEILDEDKNLERKADIFS
ncbi:MAG: InlB B-repeat-containing protein, partial [Clostridia bacterium]|nr:InlB B-repeat-containing protein [Clostridia bacterium]